jgi:hypothetical protein
MQTVRFGDGVHHRSELGHLRKVSAWYVVLLLYEIQYPFGLSASDSLIRCSTRAFAITFVQMLM